MLATEMNDQELALELELTLSRIAYLRQAGRNDARSMRKAHYLIGEMTRRGDFLWVGREGGWIEYNLARR